jgi:hypothetical protein
VDCGGASIYAHRRVRSASDARLSLTPPAGSCDRMLGVHAHAPHDPSRTSARDSCGRHRSSPLRPRSTHTPAMPSDATGGWPCPCLHPPCVSSRAHHFAHYSAHGHMQRRAYMRALAHVYMRKVAYAHSTSHTRSRSDTLVRTCAHAHAHSQTDRFTRTDGISQERHTQTHTCTHMHTRTHTQLPTYKHTHMNTHRHTNDHALIQAYTQSHTPKGPPKSSVGGTPGWQLLSSARRYGWPPPGVSSVSFEISAREFVGPCSLLMVARAHTHAHTLRTHAQMTRTAAAAACKSLLLRVLPRQVYKYGY